MELITLIQNTLLIGVLFFTLVIGITYIISHRKNSKRKNKNNKINYNREQIKEYNLAYLESRQRTVRKPDNLYSLNNKYYSHSQRHESVSRNTPTNSDVSRRQPTNRSTKTYKGDRHKNSQYYNPQPRFKVINDNSGFTNNSRSTKKTNYYNPPRGNYVSGSFYG